MRISEIKRVLLGCFLQLWFVRKLYRVAGRDVTFAFNFPKWKRAFVERCFPQERLVYLPIKGDIRDHHWLISRAARVGFLVWGHRQPEGLETYAARQDIKVRRMEDGFIRSVGLGSRHILPMSVCVDDDTLYYDARSESGLENILQSYDFKADTHLMLEAGRCMEFIRTHGLTKYNLPPTRLGPQLYGAKERKRILVIGQVEDDQSIRYGCDRKISNNDVVRLAAEENPDAQIIYKVHPDVLAGMRPELSNPREVADIAQIVSCHMSLDDALTGVDRVYTISSLAGFESLLRDVPVTTVGCPFYAGWGLTDDRQMNARRTRRLEIAEVFAGAYLLYAKYFDPLSGTAISLIDAMKEISARLTDTKPQAAEMPQAESQPG